MSRINPNINSNDDLERIAAILAPDSSYNEELEEFDIPEVSYDSLEVFEDFLNGSVNSGTELTGRESLGYFSWEERFEFQGKVGSKEYLDIKKEKASCRDIFIFLNIGEVNEEYGIIAKVKRKESSLR